MLFIPEVAARIEEHLYDTGVPTKVYCLSPSGEMQFAVVFPMGREFDLHEGLASAQAELAPLVGQLDISPRTVLKHFAYDLFATIPRPQGVFISTNVVNLPRPRSVMRKVRVLQIGASGMRPKFSEREVEALGYDLDMVLISHDQSAVANILPQMRDCVHAFNMDSRFIQIGRLRWAWTQSRMVVGDAQLSYQELGVGAS